VPSGLRKGRYPLATTRAPSGVKRGSTPPSAPPGVTKVRTSAPSEIRHTLITLGLGVHSANVELSGEKVGRVPPLRVRTIEPSEVRWMVIVPLLVAAVWSSPFGERCARSLPCRSRYRLPRTP
jgi:hypothetical protein